MIVVELTQLLFGVSALVTCAIACRMAIRGDRVTGIYLATAGLVSLIFFLTVPGIRYEIFGITALAIVCGLLMSRALDQPDSLDDTAVRRRSLR